MRINHGAGPEGAASSTRSIKTRSQIENTLISSLTRTLTRFHHIQLRKKPIRASVHVEPVAFMDHFLQLKSAVSARVDSTIVVVSACLTKFACAQILQRFQSLFFNCNFYCVERCTRLLSAPRRDSGLIGDETRTRSLAFHFAA
jgi:hypothetical protein